MSEENYQHLEIEELNELLEKISRLTSEDLNTVMNAISYGLIWQRDIASKRAVDFESAVANLARENKITATKWRNVFDRFIAPHIDALRTPSLPDMMKKRAKHQ